jgi:SNF2 family DNA or RNA helicase
MGYEQLLRDFEAVRAFGPDIVVLDEAQRIKNYATKSATYVKALQPPFRLVLTGTPMENRLDELASILDWVDDLALAPKWRLVPWHTAHEGDGARGVAGARNLKVLRARLAGPVVRRVRAEVIAQLPPRTDTRVPVPMTERQRAEHDALDPSIRAILQRAKSRPLTQPEFIKLMQLLTLQRIYCNGVGLARFEESWPSYGDTRPDRSRLDALFAPKLDELRRLVHDLVVLQGRKVVVFSQWRRMLRLAAWSVRDILEAAGLRAVFFTGAESLAQRTKSVVDLHDDDRARVMFLSDAGGTGLNLQRAASACINIELPWNPAVLEQRIGRIYRLGQARPIDVFNLVTDEGIESRIADVVRTKSALFRGVFDGSSDEVRFEASASFVARVEQLVAPVAASAPPLLEPSYDEEEPEEQAPADEVPRVAADQSPGLGHLLSSLRVERTASGGIRLEAPAEAAEPLAALFGALAAMLRPRAAERPS